MSTLPLTRDGLPAAPDFFPLAVWLQSPANAARYRAIGINLYIGLWEGPTAAQLDTLKAAGMPVICEQNALGLSRKDDPIIAGWMHGDEPDNAQQVVDPKTGKKDWGPCIPPEKIVADYRRLRETDAARPILLNLGQGVANDAWIGRGAGAKLDDYKTYVKGGDIVSFDVYPVADNLSIALVPKGLDRLSGWSGGKKPIWNCLECTAIGGKGKATPSQVRRQTWLSLVHGSRGLIYFVHQFAPTFNEHALLDDPPMRESVAATNRQIAGLARVLNGPMAKNPVTARGVDTLLKRSGRSLYLFAATADEAQREASFTIADLPARAVAEDLTDGRRLPIQKGAFTDTLPPDGVRLYRIG